MVIELHVIKDTCKNIFQDPLLPSHEGAALQIHVKLSSECCSIRLNTLLKTLSSLHCYAIWQNRYLCSRVLKYIYVKVHSTFDRK